MARERNIYPVTIVCVAGLDNRISANFSPSHLHSAIVAIFPPVVTVNGGPN